MAARIVPAPEQRIEAEAQSDGHGQDREDDQNVENLHAVVLDPDRRHAPAQRSETLSARRQNGRNSPTADILFPELSHLVTIVGVTSAP